jgi:hypothetical protein
MQITHFESRPPQLVQALEALAQRADKRDEVETLFDELCGITVLVAKKFTNDRTADGIQEAFQLVIGCISLGISQANIPDEKDAKLSFLLQHGAEYVFQMGFRHIKELSSLPFFAIVSDFESDPFVHQRNLKATFLEICRADPNSPWSGDAVYARTLLDRKKNQKIIACAKWLRTKHYSGPIKDAELDAHAVISIAVIFAIAGIAPIVARLKQVDLEILIQGVRETSLDVESCWSSWLIALPSEYHEILRERMDEFRNTILVKILSKTKIKTVIMEIQNHYAGNEQDIEYN